MLLREQPVKGPSLRELGASSSARADTHAATRLDGRDGVALAPIREGGVQWQLELAQTGDAEPSGKDSDTLYAVKHRLEGGDGKGVAVHTHTRTVHVHGC